MLDFIRREPALIVGVVLAVIGLLAAFGLTISEEQKAAIVAFIGAVLALLGAGVTRSKVTPFRTRTTTRRVPTERGQVDAAYLLKVIVLALVAVLIVAVLFGAVPLPIG